MDETRQMITIKLRLRDRHSAALNRQAAAVNFVWNYCNETSRTAWERDRRWLSDFELGKLTSGSSVELGLHSHSIKRVVREFAHRRDHRRRAGLRWRGRRSLGWVPFSTGHARVAAHGQIKFHGAIYETMHWRDEMTQDVAIRAGSFNRDVRGRWYLNALIETPTAIEQAKQSVGVDIGLKDLATLSDGRKFEAPRLYRASEAALATAQRARKAPKRVRNIHAKVANRRKDYLHKVSATIAKEYGIIVVGDVPAKKLARTKMAKSVHDAGWSMLRNMLAYKAIRHGGRYIAADERMTTQTCSECGTLPPSRPRGIAGLGIREWECSDCGTVHDRDVNAARNILRVGLDALTEGAGTRPEQPLRRAGSLKDTTHAG